MKTLAQNINIGGKAFPTIQALKSIDKLDQPGKFGSNILIFGTQVLIVATIVLAVGFLIWGGISWSMSGGDKTKLQAARNTVTYAIVGLIIALTAFSLVNFIGHFFLGSTVNLFRQ